MQRLRAATAPSAAWSAAVCAAPRAVSILRRSAEPSREAGPLPAKPLIEQLKVGARLVMPLGPAHALRSLIVIEKIAPSETRTRSITLVGFVPFTQSKD